MQKKGENFIGVSVFEFVFTFKKIFNQANKSPQNVIISINTFSTLSPFPKLKLERKKGEQYFHEDEDWFEEIRHCLIVKEG